MSAKIKGRRGRYNYPGQRYFVYPHQRKVTGVWDFAGVEGPAVKLYLFDKVTKSTLQQVFLQAERLGKFIAEEDVRVIECNHIIPLTQSIAGGFMPPLKSC